MEFAVRGLPSGLKLDTETGIISGVIADTEQKEYALTFVAKNKKGEQKKKFKIVVGNTISLTPPMGGWNSWNCWGGPDVTQKKCDSFCASNGKQRFGKLWLELY